MPVRVGVGVRCSDLLASNDAIANDVAACVAFSVGSAGEDQSERNPDPDPDPDPSGSYQDGGRYFAVVAARQTAIALQAHCVPDLRRGCWFAGLQVALIANNFTTILTRRPLTRTKVELMSTPMVTSLSLWVPCWGVQVQVCACVGVEMKF